MTCNDALDAMQALDELKRAAVAFTIQAAIEAGVFIEDPTALRALENHLLATVNRPCPVMTHDMWCVTADLMVAGHVNPVVEARRASEAVVESVTKMMKLGIKLAVPQPVDWQRGTEPECEEEP